MTGADHLTLGGARWKSALVILGAAGFVALGVFLAGQPRTDARVVGVIAVILFGLFGVLGAVQLVRPVKVVLGPAGFTVTAFPYPPRTTAWSDVGEFFIWKHQASKFVAFRYAPGKAPDTLLTKVNRGLGLEGYLPAGLKPGPERVLKIMEEWKARASG